MSRTTAGPRWCRPAMQCFCLLGSLFCLANAFGADLLCVTQGCRIYQGYGLFGIPFYILGAGGFLALLAVVSFRILQPLLALALFAALALDTLFLIYQYLFWPCASCMVVALLMGAVAGLGLLGMPSLRKPWLLGSGIVWLTFFLVVGLATIKEVAFRPWAMWGSPTAPVKVYFSPNCPACREAVEQLLEVAEPAAVALYPVAKSAADLAPLGRALETLASGKPDTLRASLAEMFAAVPIDRTAETPTKLGWRVRWGLWSNKMMLARMGSAEVPKIIAPGPIQGRPRPNTPAAGSWQWPGLPTTPGCPAFADEGVCE
jgi:hypothetical protein